MFIILNLLNLTELTKRKHKRNNNKKKIFIKTKITYS